MRRLDADRYRRIWAIVTTVADEPGHSREELARKFFVSERQVQADLNIIRTDMRLPMVRRQGYRFVDEGAGTSYGPLAPDLREAQLLVLVLRRAQRDRSIPQDELDGLLAKLPGMFAPHLRPLVAWTLQAASDPRRQVVEALGDAMLRGATVKLHWAVGGGPTLDMREIVARPELLLPHLDGWYVLAECEGGSWSKRQRMLSLDGIEAVTLAATGSERS